MGEGEGEGDNDGGSSDKDFKPNRSEMSMDADCVFGMVDP